MNKPKFYLTTPLYYVNAKPHLGTLYSTLLADVTARVAKLQGREVFFLTGTDEHGQKLQNVADEKGMEPKAFVDSMVPEFKKAWKEYGIEYDKFIRTTDTEHEDAVVHWIKKLQEQGDIYTDTYTGWYCVPCETFVTVDTKETKHTCPTCSRELTEISEENYFFRLSAYEDKLLAFYEENPNFIVPKERINEVISFVKGGLSDLSISRTGVKWGIPFPGDAKQTIYVWADALLNYVSAIGYGSEDAAAQAQLDKWWPADVQIMAKDILRFHAVYWPAFLMAAELPLPKKLLVHGYILTDDKKMSKSLGNVVDPSYLAKQYGVEPVRYYLMRQMSVNQDGHFSITDLEQRITADLANNLGNLLNRMLVIALKNGLTTVKPPPAWEPQSTALHVECEEAVRAYWDNMSHHQYHMALADLWKFVSRANVYFNDLKPWEAARKNKELFEEIISATCHSLYSIAIMIWPIMPKKAEEMLNSLGHTFELGRDYEEELRDHVWDKVFILKKTEGPLFMKHEPKKETQQAEPAKEETKASHITIDDFAKVELRVGKIQSCEPLEGSEKLYKLTVDLGAFGTKQVLAGVQKQFSPDQLTDKQGVYVTNLAPRKILGEESQGMMLFAKDESGHMQFVTVAGDVDNGTRLS